MILRNPSIKCLCFWMALWLVPTPGWGRAGDNAALVGNRPRVVVSTDIGGTDPDDFQSMVHLLVYADVLDIEGLISSPYGPGRKRDILDVIACYETDYSNLRTWSDAYPVPQALRSITKQGETERAPYGGVRWATEGSEWLVACARRDDPRLLHVLVWGGIEDLAQALHDAPDIAGKLRVYWIGGPNKKWSADAYQYIVDHHPGLWMIEANDTYRGWFIGGDQSGTWGNAAFVSRHVAGAGALGRFFVGKMDEIKMGDSPSVGWLLKGDPVDPAQPGWGGSFVRAWDRASIRMHRMPVPEDRIEAFSVLELILPLGEEVPEHPVATLRVENQALAGHAPGDGTMRFRFSPKAVRQYDFKVESNVASLDGRTGGVSAVRLSPERAARPSLAFPNWWTDDPDPAAGEGTLVGTRTVSRWRESFLSDFAERLKRCTTPCTVPEAVVPGKPRVLVTSDGEIDDECSMVRFLLYANEWDIEGIVTSSSQYHWQGHKWAGDDWVQPYLEAYAEVYPNLVQHDPRYPTPDRLRSRTLLGNVKAEGEMEEVTPGSQRIVDVLLDNSDPRPVWIQAWGGPNTIARALKSIEETHPERMPEVAGKIRLYLIWEQDDTYQRYIRPHWGRYGLQTIVSDQFIAIFYHWKKYLPPDMQAYLVGPWMKSNILDGHGPLCALYKAHGAGEEGFAEGDFRSEGDSPAFLHTIPTGLRSVESPGWGGWGGRFVNVRENTWLDPVTEPGYSYPPGRWYTSTAWGRTRLKAALPNDKELTAYLKPQWRWIDAVQNDFAARADWCVRSYAEANHPPIVKLDHPPDLSVSRGAVVQLSAEGTRDPDGDTLSYRWWHYPEAGSAAGPVVVENAGQKAASLTVPADAEAGDTLHLICEVRDTGQPPLTRYQRVVLTVME